MHNVKVPHGDVLSGAQSFIFLTSRNGLTAAKVAKVRAALIAEKKASAEGFDVIAQQFATMTTAPEGASEDERAAFVPKPIVRRGEAPAQSEEDKKAGKPAPEGQEQHFQLSQTKAYLMTDENLKAFEHAQEAFMKEPVELSAPEFTEADMNQLTYSLPDGRDIAIPSHVSDVLMHFAPAF